MYNRYENMLEYNKILEILSDFGASEVTKDRILSLKPNKILDECVHMQKETSEAVSMIVKSTPPALKVKNIISSVKKAELGGIISTSELLAIANLLKVAKNIERYFTNEDEESIPILTGIMQGIGYAKEVCERIIACIITEDEIADDASRDLFDIRRKIRTLNNKIKDSLNDMIRNTTFQKYLQDPIVSMRGDRYVLPVKSENRVNVPGVVHDTSSSGATLFIEPLSVVNMNNEISELYVKEHEEINKILSELSALVAEHTGVIIADYECITELDFIFAKAKFALKYDCSEPILNNDGYINLKKARHPLIDKKVVVANDIYLGKEFNTLIITGPNTGGKTVTLKTVGLFALMVASGIQLPVLSGSSMAIFDEVFADIGDEQSIEQNLSTFSSHMTNIVNILGKVNENCLVLFDELGAGTDPTEGSALAISILEYLKNIGVKVLITTHYSELKVYAQETKGILNASCEFDVVTLSPTYKLLIGVPGKSNAFAISKRLGLSDDIIENAKNKLSTQEKKFEDVIADLTEQRNIVEQESASAQKLTREIEELRLELEKEKDKLKETKAKLIEDAKKEAKKIINQTKAEASDLLKQAVNLKQNATSKTLNKDIEELRTKINQKDKELSSGMGIKKISSNNKVNISVIKIGTNVKVLSIDQVGSVMTLPDNNGDMFVRVGIMKITANINDIELSQSKETKKVDSFIRNKKDEFIAKNIKTEIDVRGKDLETAIAEVDKFLDDASLCNITTVTIIHGKGTGVLRSGLSKMLRGHKHVRTFRLGVYGEGESGVTIVEIK